MSDRSPSKMSGSMHSSLHSSVLSRPQSHRTISNALRAARSREEQETLLGDDDEEAATDADGCLRQTEAELHPTNPHRALPVYRTIHRIRRLVMALIDDPYPVEELKGSQLNNLIVKPLVNRLYDPDDISTVYCLLVNRAQFLRDQSYMAHHQTVNLTRASLCELVAARILRRFDEDNEGKPGLLLLANVLVAGFEPFQCAPDEIMAEHRLEHHWVHNHPGYERTLTALEIAIVGEAKTFLSCAACQKIVEAVYLGRVVYTPTSFIDIIPDHYKHKPIALYDPRKAPLLNHYRLIVPRTRNLIEVVQFLILFILYAVTMINRNHYTFTTYEIVFCIYAAGWVLDEFASILEHGWTVHTQNLWSFLDITFVAIYFTYIAVRLYGWIMNDMEAARQAIDILSTAAPVLLPRLAFNIMPENMLFISLRAMMGDFMVLTGLAVWCFAGFLLGMKWLSRWSSPADHSEPPDSITISKWMLWIWFGLDGTGIQRSIDFHLILGPILMITFAFLGNTLFLTILVSMLSNTFSKIVADATAEIQFRRAVLTFEGVKSDAIFAYRPPFNIVAIFVLLPLKFILTPRWFHKINVTMVRILNAPILVVISVYERRRLWKTTRTAKRGISRKSDWADFWSLNVHADIQLVFEAEPPKSMLEEIEEEDVLDEDMWEGNVMNRTLRDTSPGSQRPGSQGGDTIRKRRFSSVVPFV